ncbi:MAG TPA: PadR family transcriptional regulator [Actinomycetota bacterium]|nr:PadR family transcriptional regulator [Actinomycetota bacterium]
MSVPYVLLGLLEESPRHGYELKRDYDELVGQSKPVKFGQIYATLGRLERDGLIDLAAEERGQGPDRKRYAITENGVTDLDQWLSEPETAEPHMHNVLFTKVVLAMFSNREPELFLNAQRAEHQRRMRDLTRIKEEGSLAAALASDYALFHLEADLRWIELASARLERLRKEVKK